MDIDKLPEAEQPTEGIKALLGRAQEISEALKDEKANTAELKGSLGEIRDQINELQKVEDQRRDQAERTAILADLEALKESTRRPSKAADVARTQPGMPNDGEESFFSTLAFARSTRVSGSHKASLDAEARLAEMGSRWMGPNPESKATLGTTDAAGGYLVPNNVVSALNFQATPGRAVVDLFTVINDVRGTGVDIPFEDANSVFSRAVIAPVGDTKENSNLLTNNYTATLYTLARIYDVSNQLLRQSQGAAEQMVRNALARAFALGEDYYAIQGSGSSEPYGLLTALGASGTYVTSHTPSASTVAGNWAAGLAKAAGAVASRGAIPDAAVFNSGDYWTNLASGADAAGFYVDPSGGGFNFGASAAGNTAAGPWGIRIRHTPNMPTDSMVVGEFSRALFFRGQSYRVDVSSEAGTRWDKNLTGFRGEEEIAFDARPFVYTGLFQRITNILA
jgi:HK97 family phage major capsid protein